MTPAPTDPAVESLLAFWRDAGVADCFEDVPQDRLTEGARRLRASATAPAAAPRAALPATMAPDTAEAVAAAREAALTANDLDALREAIEAFQATVMLAGGPRRTVFARGAHDAELLVIGEAPGGDEDARALPFVGPAGKLLDKALAAAGLAECSLITNTVFWRSPGDRMPTAQEQAVCAPFLDRAIWLVRPKALLLLGAAATRTVLREEGGVLGLRGRWFERVSDDGTLKIPATPSLHPAFLLRQPESKKLFWKDLLALGTRLESLERPE